MKKKQKHSDLSEAHLEIAGHWAPLALIAAAAELLAAAIRVNALSIQTDAHKELRAAIANATGDDDAAPECTCAAKDMTFGRFCKVTPNA